VKRMSDRRTRPWWSKGLRFTCLPDCGRCCDEPDGIVFLSLSDAQRLAEHHDLDVDAWVKRDCVTSSDGRHILRTREHDRICIYLGDDMRCTVYSAKPDQCSAFPWWTENLATKEGWADTKELCPGIDHPTAIVVEQDTIRLWIEKDLHSLRGFR